MKIRGNKLGGKRHYKPALAAVALGALMSFQPGAAWADDTAAEIRLLKARLKHLEERVAEQARKEKETQAQIKHAAAQPGPPPAPGSYPVGIGLPPQPPYGNTLAERLAKIKGYPYVGSSSLYLGGMSITPGGFLELGSVTRDHFIGADLATPFGNIPFANVPSSHTAEFRLSARRSRLSFLAMGDVDPATHLSGYGEFDFLGDAQTGNSNESNSFNPRIRHLYATVDNDDFGAHLLAGQAWTFVFTGSGVCEQQWGWDITGAYKHYWLPILSSAVYGSYLEVHYPANALAGFGGAVGVSNLKEARIGTNLIWTPLKGFDIGAEFMYVHLNETRPVGLAPDFGPGSLTANGLPAFHSNNNQYEGRLRVQRAF